VTPPATVPQEEKPTVQSDEIQPVVVLRGQRAIEFPSRELGEHSEQELREATDRHEVDVAPRNPAESRDEIELLEAVIDSQYETGEQEQCTCEVERSKPKVTCHSHIHGRNPK